jgi:hypothetical protein
MKTVDSILRLAQEIPGMRASDFSRKLSISPQAIHRHLRRLCSTGVLEKRGCAPHTGYHATTVSNVSSSARQQIKEIQTILAAHPAIRLVTLFGSVARGRSRANSDIDLLVWLGKDEPFGKHEIWQFWDRHSRDLPWRNRVSLVVRRCAEKLFVDTLLLDLPEEHIPVHDPHGYFHALRQAVVDWRRKWKSKKLLSFGGKHAWIYSTRVKTLAEIDFHLESPFVA